MLFLTSIYSKRQTIFFRICILTNNVISLKNIFFYNNMQHMYLELNFGNSLLHKKLYNLGIHMI